MAETSESAEMSLDWSFDDVTEAELQDFLAADDEPEQADPAFKSRLREQLWTMIQKDDLPRQ
jgi:DNA-directed RNA polymerase sigma subunit (sigma70/sigma32)